MNIHYNQDYTKEKITGILSSILDCISEDRYIISRNENRQENNDFIAEYNLNSERQKQILLGITPEDFCHSLMNTNVGYEHEVLYVFVPQIRLFNFGGIEKLVDVYIKFNLIDYYGGKRTIIISFHKRNKPISYCFR